MTSTNNIHPSYALPPNACSYFLPCPSCSQSLTDLTATPPNQNFQFNPCKICLQSLLPMPSMAPPLNPAISIQTIATQILPATCKLDFSEPFARSLMGKRYGSCLRRSKLRIQQGLEALEPIMKQFIQDLSAIQNTTGVVKKTSP